VPLKVADHAPIRLVIGWYRPLWRSFDGIDYSLPMTKTVARDLPLVRIAPSSGRSFGIMVLDKDLNERVVNLLPPNTPVPCEKRGRFAYAYPNMTAVRVEATEGTGSSRDEVKVVGEVVLGDLPARPRGTVIDVIYRYDGQSLQVDVIDVETKVKRSARFVLDD